MIYFISGLGADERVFQFLDLAHHEFRHIQWVTTQKGESLTDYAIRLIDQIDGNQDIILIGVSFGGMIAQEIAKQISCKTVIIISSVKSPEEFDWQLSFVRKTQLHQFVPAAFLKWSNLLTADYYFGVSAKQESELLRQIVLDTDTTFMVWAIDAIMRWENDDPLLTIHHIHGTQDKIFPRKPIKNAHFIEGGGHFMIVNKAAEISQLILNIIQ
ncbi:MAG: alpha/beta hydrolase [Flammeovirgaceae bacterium]